MAGIWMGEVRLSESGSVQVPALVGSGLADDLLPVAEVRSVDSVEVRRVPSLEEQLGLEAREARCVVRVELDHGARVVAARPAACPAQLVDEAERAARGGSYSLPEGAHSGEATLQLRLRQSL